MIVNDFNIHFINLLMYNLFHVVPLSSTWARVVNIYFRSSSVENPLSLHACYYHFILSFALSPNICTAARKNRIIFVAACTAPSDSILHDQFSLDDSCLCVDDRREE
jgi:hypothetical protein